MNVLSSLTATSPSVASSATGSLRALFFWRVLGVVVCAVLLAKWTWVFVAPKDAALPTTTAWKKTAGADRLFGVAPVVSVVSSAENLQLIGVFAHRSAGFAVLLVDGKQMGVGLGELVQPGVRLVETQASYVVVERNGVQSRVALAASSPAVTGITRVDSNSSKSATAMPPQTAILNTPMGSNNDPEYVAHENQINPIPPEQRALMSPQQQQQLDGISPQQRAGMQRELDHFRRRP
jgi:hypothetical protein